MINKYFYILTLKKNIAQTSKSILVKNPKSIIINKTTNVQTLGHLTKCPNLQTLGHVSKRLNLKLTSKQLIAKH